MIRNVVATYKSAQGILLKTGIKKKCGDSSGGEGLSGGVGEWVSVGVLSVVIHLPLLITHHSLPISHQPTDQILARMSGMLDLSSEENAKHLLPR